MSLPFSRKFTQSNGHSERTFNDIKVNKWEIHIPLDQIKCQKCSSRS